MDFNDRLKEAINSQKMPLPTSIGLPGTAESASFYAMPGGQVTREYMDGEKDVALAYEYVIHSQDQEASNDQLWQVQNYLETLTDLDSKDGSYQFGTISITSKPAFSQAEEPGFFYWVVDFTANLTTFK